MKKWNPPDMDAYGGGGMHWRDRAERTGWTESEFHRGLSLFLAHAGRPIPWHRPAWATEASIWRLKSAFEDPERFALAIDYKANAIPREAARDVLTWLMAVGEKHAIDDERTVERLAGAIQEHAEALIRLGGIPLWSLPDDRIENWSIADGLEKGWPPIAHVVDDTLVMRWRTQGEAGEDGEIYTMPHWRALEPDELARLDELAMVDTASGRVPWLSVQLAEYLRRTFGADDIADTWLTEEAQRERERATQVEAPGIVPSFALPGWSKRWKSYNTPPALAMLALGVWDGVVWPALEREAASRERAKRWHGPALPLRIAHPVLTQGRRVNVDVLRWALRSLHTLAGHRLVRWLARVTWRTAVENGINDGVIRATMNHAGGVGITVQGGIQGLADTVAGGNASGKDRVAVREALDALVNVGPAEWATEVEHGRVSGLVSSVVVLRGGPGRPGVVDITLPPLWTPGAVHRVPRGLPSRVLVPILPVPSLPPKVERLAPALAGLDSEAVIYLATHADELVNEGGVRIPWEWLAVEREINDVALRTALDWWTNEEPRWARSRGDRWTLADVPELEGARALLAESGNIRTRASLNGRRSALAKREGKGKRRG